MGGGASLRFLPLIAALGLVLAGCASSPEPEFAKGHHGRFQVGRPNYQIAPYQVNGVWYYPKVDYDYDETGTASWYGPGFDHRPTADGEIYDMNALSAAHKTLPLPSVVMVTNLRNGRALRLRVNDRGPFADDRLIDVSRRAAQLLGFETAGTAPVRIRVLKAESVEVADAAMHHEFGLAGTGVAAASPTVRTEVASRPRVAPQPVRVAAAAPVVQTEPSPAAQPVIAAPLPPPVATPRAAPPLRPAVVAEHRHYWPSLIATAHAETLHLPAAPVRAAVPARHSARIFIQAGAFAMPEHARKVRARIAALGSAEIVQAVVHGVALYRVRLGPLASEAEARRLLSRVIDSGYPGARVVAD